MRQLYGDTGSERIRQMEESIEADFLNEAKMLTWLFQCVVFEMLFYIDLWFAHIICLPN